MILRAAFGLRSVIPTRPRLPFTRLLASISDGFDSHADKLLATLETALAEGLEDAVPDLDIDMAYGVLTLHLGSKGTYVINKQPPTKQVRGQSGHC
jgi:frataxin